MTAETNRAPTQQEVHCFRIERSCAILTRVPGRAPHHPFSNRNGRYVLGGNNSDHLDLYFVPMLAISTYNANEMFNFRMPAEVLDNIGEYFPGAGGVPIITVNTQGDEMELAFDTYRTMASGRIGVGITHPKTSDFDASNKAANHLFQSKLAGVKRSVGDRNEKNNANESDPKRQKGDGGDGENGTIVPRRCVSLCNKKYANVPNDIAKLPSGVSTQWNDKKSTHRRPWSCDRSIRPKLHMP